MVLEMQSLSKVYNQEKDGYEKQRVVLDHAPLE
jgi:hypothetical protein